MPALRLGCWSDAGLPRPGRHLSPKCCLRESGKGSAPRRRGPGGVARTAAHLVGDGCVLGEDSDAALTLDGVAVHHPVLCLLVIGEDVRLLQHGIHQRGLAVINMGNDGDVADERPRLEGNAVERRGGLSCWCLCTAEHTVSE